VATSTAKGDGADKQRIDNPQFFAVVDSNSDNTGTSNVVPTGSNGI